MSRSPRRIPASYLAQLVSLAGSAALTFGTALILEPSARGAFAIFMVLSAVGSYVFGLGLPSQILQASARADAGLARALLLGQLLPTAALFLLATVLLLNLNPFSFAPAELLILGLLSALAGAIFNSLSWYEYGQGRFAFSTTLRGIIPLGTMLLALFVWSFGNLTPSLCGALYVVLQVAALFWLFMRHRGLWAERSSTGIKGTILAAYRASFGFYLAQALVIITNRLPVIAAGVYLGAAETAVLSIALSVAEVQTALVQIRSAMIFRQSSRVEEPRFTRRHFQDCMVAILPMTVIVIAGAAVVPWILPNAYSGLLPTVVAFTVGVIGMGLLGPAVNILTVRGQVRIGTAILSVAMIIAVVMFLAVAPQNSIALASQWSLATGLAAVGVVGFAAVRGRPGREGAASA